MNVNAFKYLVNLRTLYIPKIDPTIAEKICQQVESLDILRLTSEVYDLSCFLLSSGSTFDESTIRIGQTTLSFLENESDGRHFLYIYIRITILFKCKFNKFVFVHDFYSDLYKIPTTPSPPSSPQLTVLITTPKIIIAPQKVSKNVGLNEPKVSSQKMSSISQNETRIEEIAIPLNDSQQPPNDVEEAKVDVSIEMIYLILIGKYLKEN